MMSATQPLSDALSQASPEVPMETPSSETFQEATSEVPPSEAPIEVSSESPSEPEVASSEPPPPSIDDAMQLPLPSEEDWKDFDQVFSAEDLYLDLQVTDSFVYAVTTTEIQICDHEGNVQNISPCPVAEVIEARFELEKSHLYLLTKNGSLYLYHLGEQTTEKKMVCEKAVRFWLNPSNTDLMFLTSEKELIVYSDFHEKCRLKNARDASWDGELIFYQLEEDMPLFNYLENKNVDVFVPGQSPKGFLCRSEKALMYFQNESLHLEGPEIEERIKPATQRKVVDFMIQGDYLLILTPIALEMWQVKPKIGKRLLTCYSLEGELEPRTLHLLGSDLVGVRLQNQHIRTFKVRDMEGEVESVDSLELDLSELRDDTLLTQVAQALPVGV